MFNLICFMYMYISIGMIFQDELNKNNHDRDHDNGHDGVFERVSVINNFLSSV